MAKNINTSNPLSLTSKKENAISLYSGDLTKSNLTRNNNITNPVSETQGNVGGNEAETEVANPNANRGNYDMPRLPEQDPNTVYLDEIQKAAAEKNYKALLQSDIAAYNLKLQTQKYLDNSLAAQGLNTQGYGTSAHLGANNQAANLYAQNLENYNANNLNLTAEAVERQKTAQEAALTEADNQLVTYLSNSDGSAESIATYMNNYGYVQGKDGKWYRKDENGNPDLAQPASAYIQSAVQYAQEYGNDESVINENYTKYAGLIADGKQGEGYSIDELQAKLAIAKGSPDYGDEYIKNSGWGEVFEKLDNGTLKDGTVIHIKASGKGNESYVVYINGVFYESTKEAWQQANNRI